MTVVTVRTYTIVQETIIQTPPRHFYYIYKLLIDASTNTDITVSVHSHWRWVASSFAWMSFLNCICYSNVILFCNLMYIRCMRRLLLVRSKSKISPSRFGLCAFRAWVSGVCFLFTARGAGGCGRITSHRPKWNAQNVNLHRVR